MHSGNSWQFLAHYKSILLSLVKILVGGYVRQLQLLLAAILNDEDVMMIRSQGQDGIGKHLTEQRIVIGDIVIEE